MKIGFYGLPAPGHLNPMTALARRLQSRGHDVHMISLSVGEPLVRAAQLPFLPVCEKQFTPEALIPTMQKNSRLRGIESMEFLAGLISKVLQAVLEDLPAVLQREGIDAIALDEAQVGLSVLPMHLGMPFATVSNALYWDFSGNTPFHCFDWPNEATPAGRTRNLEALKTISHIFEPARSVARAYADRVGLKIDWTDPFALNSKLVWITQVPEAFDFKGVTWPSQFHYTGPFVDGQRSTRAGFPWEKLTGEPLVYASMGTAQNGIESVFDAITEAVGQHRGTQLVLSTGPFIHPQSLKAVPANAIILPHVPQLEILKRASLCITHAGMNSALEALAQGVPMVAIPVTNDQPGVAARIAYTKTGTVVPIEQLSTERLSAAIGEVLRNPEYRQNAAKMKKNITETNGLEKAADLLEEAFTLHGAKGERSLAHSGA